jgi:hypothetical protein
VLIVSSEARGSNGALAALLKGPHAGDGGATDDPLGSHLLCAFTPAGRVNFGDSDDWADLDRFEAAALDLAPRLIRGKVR